MAHASLRNVSIDGTRKMDSERRNRGDAGFHARSESVWGKPRPRPVKDDEVRDRERDLGIFPPSRRSRKRRFIETEIVATKADVESEPCCSIV
jgi:hypothetical protein